MSQNVIKYIRKDAQPQQAGIQSDHESKSSLHVCIICHQRNCGGVSLAQRQAGSWGWESKECAELVDLGCTAGLQPDKGARGEVLVQIKHQGKAMNQPVSLSSTTVIGQGNEWGSEEGNKQVSSYCRERPDTAPEGKGQGNMNKSRDAKHTKRKPQCCR